MTDSDSMVDVPAPEAVTSPIQVTYIVQHSLLAMEDMVAVQKGLVSIQGEYWSKAVVKKLNHASVRLLKDFIVSALEHSLNLLTVAGHRQLLHTTLMMMFEEVAKLVFGPNVGLGVGAP
jgi:glucokinase